MLTAIKLTTDHSVSYSYYARYDAFCFVEMFVALYEHLNDFR